MGYDQTSVPDFRKGRGIGVQRQEPNTTSAGSSSSIRLLDVSGATNEMGVLDMQEARVDSCAGDWRGASVVSSSPFLPLSSFKLEDEYKTRRRSRITTGMRCGHYDGYISGNPHLD